MVRPGLSIERSRDSTPRPSRNGRRRPPSPSFPFSQFEAESAHVFSFCFERLGPYWGRGAVIFGLYRCFNVPN